MRIIEDNNYFKKLDRRTKCSECGSIFDWKSDEPGVSIVEVYEPQNSTQLIFNTRKTRMYQLYCPCCNAMLTLDKFPNEFDARMGRDTHDINRTGYKGKCTKCLGTDNVLEYVCPGEVID